MKIKLIFFVFLLGWIFFGGVGVSFAQEFVNQYDVRVLLKRDGKVEITEDINYDFGSGYKHGIWRTIPYKYETKRGYKRTIKIKKLEVLLDGGKCKYKTKKRDGNLEIKIGDPNRTLTGQHHYRIKYIVKDAWNYFAEHDEFYWNVIGGEWKVPIKKSSATIKGEGIVKRDCFQGVYGSVQKCKSIIDGENEIHFEFYPLKIGEGGTIVVGLQKGVIKEPSLLEKWFAFLLDNLFLFWPVIISLWAFQRWWKHGRDPKGRGTIIPYYDVVDNLSVAETSAIVYNSLRSRDVSAMIIQLAVKGFLKIKPEKTGKIFKHLNYTFLRVKGGDESEALLTSEEKILYEALFEFGENGRVTMDDLKNKFYGTVKEIQKQTLDKIKDKGYLPKSSKFNGGLIIFVAVIQMFFFILWSKFFGDVVILPGVVSFFILVFFAMIMKRRTKKGVETKEKLLGLKMYLQVAEKDRLKFHNAPEKTPERFEKLLPYAMVFGVEKEWAEQFKDIYKEPPEWYQGGSQTGFNSAVLADNLNSFTKTASANMFSSPSSAGSGGSGFSGGGSGGGFGGGGGGSW